MSFGVDDRIESNRHRNLIFAAPADDPRARRPVDVALLIGSLVVVVLLGWAYRSGADIDARVFTFFANGLPSWISGLATAAFVAGGVYGIGLILALGLFGQGRAAIARDMLLAATFALVGVIAASYLAGPEFPDVFPELLERNGYPSYPVIRIATMVAATGVAKPFLSLPMRTVGRRLMVAMVVSSIVLNYGTVTAVGGAVALGIAASAAVHLIFGSGRGIPSRARILAALAEARVDVDDIEYLPNEPGGATLVRARRTDGGDLLVKVYGRDAADTAFAARLWRAMWYRGEAGSLTVSRAQLAEHEALVLLALEREGVPATRLVGGARVSTGDLVIVSELPAGRALAAMTDDEIDDAGLGQIWGLFERLHASGAAHGGIDRRSVVLTADGAVLAGADTVELLASEDDQSADRAQLLVATSLAVGNERAIAAAIDHVDRDRLMDVLPLLQTPALPRALQVDIHARKTKIADLRGGLAEALDVEAPELVQLHRVSWGGVAMIGLTLFAVYSLVTSLTTIGFDTIADQYSNAIWTWVAVAFVMAQLTNIGEYFTLTGVIGSAVPFGPTMMFRYAISFISLAVPSDAGAIAMSVRYQQKLGVPAAAAIAQGPLLTIISKGFDIVLLLITAQFVGRTVDVGEVDFGPVVRLVGLVIVIAVVAIVVVAVTPKLRARMVPHLKEGFHSVKGSLTDPHRLLQIMGGTLFQKVVFAITLSASVSAFGSSLPFGSAIFVNTAVSLFIGLVPVPGGIGIGETALTAGLVAVGIPSEAALAAAITHRMVTSYIPPVFGWWASRWLTSRDYL